MSALPEMIAINMDRSDHFFTSSKPAATQTESAQQLNSPKSLREFQFNYSTIQQLNMNSFTSHKPSFFSPVILFSGLLILALALHGSPMEIRNLEQAYWGMSHLTDLMTNDIFTSMGISQEDVNNTLPIVSSIR